MPPHPSLNKETKIGHNNPDVVSPAPYTIATTLHISCVFLFSFFLTLLVVSKKNIGDGKEAVRLAFGDERSLGDNCRKMSNQSWQTDRLQIPPVAKNKNVAYTFMFHSLH